MVIVPLPCRHKANNRRRRCARVVGSRYELNVCLDCGLGDPRLADDPLECGAWNSQDPMTTLVACLRCPEVYDARLLGEATHDCVGGDVELLGYLLWGEVRGREGGRGRGGHGSKDTRRPRPRRTNSLAR